MNVTEDFEVSICAVLISQACNIGLEPDQIQNILAQDVVLPIRTLPLINLQVSME